MKKILQEKSMKVLRGIMKLVTKFATGIWLVLIIGLLLVKAFLMDPITNEDLQLFVLTGLIVAIVNIVNQVIKELYKLTK